MCCGCVLESPQGGDSNTHPQHIILWRNIENFTFYHFYSDPKFHPFLLPVRWKSGVTFVRRCFRDEKAGSRQGAYFVNSSGIIFLMYVVHAH